MSLELRGRPAPARCPYCHDQLELPELDLVECPGCGTHHHQVCLDELGGCTVQGCPEAGSGSGPPEARSVEAIRTRIRERAQRYAKNRTRYSHGGPPQLGPGIDLPPRPDLLLILRELVAQTPNCPLILVGLFCLTMLAIVIWAALTGA